MGASERGWERAKSRNGAAIIRGSEEVGVGEVVVLRRDLVATGSKVQCSQSVPWW
jgi:hypothetical protein